MTKRVGRTTIWLKCETKALLKQAGVMGESWDSLIRRLVSGQGTVWLDLLAVDGDAPGKHSIFIQVGNEPPRYYHYEHGVFTETKKPKILLEKESRRNNNAKNSDRA